MRIPSIFLMKKSRAPQDPNNVPFQEILPMGLKNRVSGKSDSSSEVYCLQEMAVLVACLKDNDFAENYCGKEISSFKKCSQHHMDKNFQAKQSDTQGIITPGNKLNYKQLNRYMRRYPNP